MIPSTAVFWLRSCNYSVFDISVGGSLWRENVCGLSSWNLLHRFCKLGGFTSCKSTIGRVLSPQKTKWRQYLGNGDEKTLVSRMDAACWLGNNLDVLLSPSHSLAGLRGFCQAERSSAKLNPATGSAQLSFYPLMHWTSNNISKAYKKSVLGRRGRKWNEKNQNSSHPRGKKRQEIREVREGKKIREQNQIEGKKDWKTERRLMPLMWT